MPNPLSYRIVSFAFVVFLGMCGVGIQAQQLILINSGKQPRLPEVIQIPLSEFSWHVGNLEHLRAEEVASHKLLSTQVYSSPEGPSHDLLLIAVQMPEAGKLAIEFRHDAGGAGEQPLVFGREAPERKDDFAWENEYVTYRVYGPALEAAGEITSGIDVWSKRVPNFVIDRFYKRDAEGQRTDNPALSYHKDDGIGLDSYLVGPTRGCGGTGIFSNGKLWVSKNYTHLKQISSGPVRFQFELTYAPWLADGIEVTETKRITLDAGTHLNKIESTFTFKGADTINVAAGLPIRAGADFQPLQQDQILSVWDTPQDPTAGRIATGIVNSPGQSATIAEIDEQAKQALLIHAIRYGETFTYYAGSGWSKADMPTPEAWQHYLKQIHDQLLHPVRYHWQ